MSFVSGSNTSYFSAALEQIESSPTTCTQSIQKVDWPSFESTPPRNRAEEDTVCCTPHNCREQDREEAIRRIPEESQRARKAILWLTTKWRRDQSMIRTKTLADAKKIEEGHVALMLVNKALDLLLLESQKTQETLLQLLEEERLKTEQGSRLAHLEAEVQTLQQDSQDTSVSCHCRLM